MVEREGVNLCAQCHFFSLFEYLEPQNTDRDQEPRPEAIRVGSLPAVWSKQLGVAELGGARQDMASSQPGVEI